MKPSGPRNFLMCVHSEFMVVLCRKMGQLELTQSYWNRNFKNLLNFFDIFCFGKQFITDYFLCAHFVLSKVQSCEDVKVPRRGWLGVGCGDGQANQKNTA